MVAIVVILASVVGWLVLGQSEQDPAPQAAVDIAVDIDDDAVQLIHDGGDKIYSERTRVIWEIDGERYAVEPMDASVALSSGKRVTFVFDGSTTSTGNWGGFASPGTVDITANDEIEVTMYDTESNKLVFSDSTVAGTTGRDLPVNTGVLDQGETVATSDAGAIAGDGGDPENIGIGSAQALGSSGDVDGDGTAEVPYVDGSGNLKLTDSDGNTQTVVDKSSVASAKEPDADKTVMATGSWQGSPTSVFYANANHNKIYRVTDGGSPTLVKDVSSNGVNAVLGPGDIDGDGDNELVYAGDSQEIRYIEPDGTVKTTGFTSGSNNGIGTGKLRDVDGDGTDEAVVVDGSNNVRLIEESGATGSPAQSSVDAAKSPVTVADIDDDGSPEIVYLGVSSAELKYIDGLGGSPTVEDLTDEGGNAVDGDKTTGVIS
jgi:FlaG/FlaF family flagellin (archaellin)